MYWDGAGFFVHPSYRYGLATRFNYLDRSVGTIGEIIAPDGSALHRMGGIPPMQTPSYYADSPFEGGVSPGHFPEPTRFYPPMPLTTGKPETAIYKWFPDDVSISQNRRR